MQLNAVVLPAPLGPIRPTISHSSTDRLSPSIATRPPKRIVRSRTSSTDTAALQSAGPGFAVWVMKGELVPGEPAGDRREVLVRELLLPEREHTAGEAGHGAGDREAEELVAEDVDAVGRGDELVFAQRNQATSELGTTYPHVDVDAQEHHRERE